MLTKSRRRWSRLLARRLHRRPLLPFLLAATLAVYAVLFFTVGEVVYPLPLAEGLLLYGAFGFCFGQMGLAAIWFVSGVRGWPLKLMVGIGAAIATAILFNDNDFPAMATFCVIAFFLQTGFAGLARLTISRLRPRAGLARQGGRFSMGGVMTLMTAAAILTGLSRSADGKLLGDLMPVYLLACEATFPAVVYSMSLHARSALRLVLLNLVLVVPCYGYIIGRVFEGETFWWTVYAFGQVAVLLVWLLGLRSRGRPVPADAVATVPHETHRPSVSTSDDHGPPETSEEAAPTARIDLEG